MNGKCGPRYTIIRKGAQMRLKENRSNWKASNILRKIKPIPEEWKLHNKKDTHKWCKGKEGVPHDYVLVDKFRWRFWSHKKLKCSNCGKEKYV